MGRGASGFTMVELMFVVIIITVLATIAAPTFTGDTYADQLARVTHRIQDAIELARSRALLRGSAMRIIIRPDATALMPNVRVDESWNTSCNGFATAETQFLDAAEKNPNADCSTWVAAQQPRCGVAVVHVTNDLTLPAIKEAGVAFQSVLVGGVPATSPLVLCVNRRGRLLQATDGTGTAWTPAGNPGQGVEITMSRTEEGVVLGTKRIFIPQGGVPQVLR